MTAADPLRLLLDEHEIRRLADELFILTDRKEWAAAKALFVDGEIDVDMSSLAGGGPLRMTAEQLFAGFATGLHAGKASHHMATNYRIAVDGDGAELWAHGYAWNHVPDVLDGEDVWETWGTYRLTCARTSAGWRLTGFQYVAKRNRGNDAVRTHTA